MAETAAKKTAAKATGRTAARAVGDDLEAQRQERIQKRDNPTPDDLWEALTRPFATEDLEQLPKALRAKDDNKGTCTAGSWYCADDKPCGKYHARSVHLDYVGHAGITTRLNDVLGPGGWDFQPYALDANGLPFMTGQMFWARLTIRVGDQEVTKADLAASFNGPQEAYGDALRRCAMRFGIGTYLWSKSEAALALKQATDQPPVPEPTQEPQNRAQEAPPAERAPQGPPSHVAVLEAELNALAPPTQELVRARWSWPNLYDLTAQQAQEVHNLVDQIVAEQNAADPWAVPEDPQNAR